MNAKQLETFLTITQAGSFAACAARLNATQSTISARIQDLEAELGVTLFDRTPRRVRLTAKGRELLPYAQQVVRVFGEIRSRIGTADALSGLVRLGVAELVAVSWLPKLASTIHARYPNLTLEFRVSLTAELLEGLRAGELDIALVPGGSDASLATRSLGFVRFVWMTSGSLPAPDRPVTPEELGRSRILSLGEKSYHSDTIREWLEAAGTGEVRVDVCNSMSVIASLTAAGLGVSLLPEACYGPEIASGRLRVLTTRPPGPVVEFSAVHSRRDPTSVQALIAALAAEVSTFESGQVSPSGRDFPQTNAS